MIKLQRNQNVLRVRGFCCALAGECFFFSLGILLYWSFAFVVLKIIWGICLMMQFCIKGNHITALNIKQSQELKINQFGFLRGSTDKHFGQPMHFVDNV